jgi:hypothetical protein
LFRAEKAYFAIFFEYYRASPHAVAVLVPLCNRTQSRGEALTHQALYLNLVTNAVIVSNTVYMPAVMEQLKEEGYPVQDSDLAHVWPTRYAHLNVYGTYHFNVEEAHQRKGFRPLRRPGNTTALAKIFGLLRIFGESGPKGVVIWAVMPLSHFRGYHSDHFFNSIR